MPFNVRSLCTGRVLFGLFIVAVGVLSTLDNLGVADARRYLEYWPVALIVIGLAQFAQGCRTGGRMSGVVWIVIGSWLLLERFDLVRVSVWNLWPILLVLVGGSIVWRALFPAVRSGPRADSDQTVSALAVMSGVERVNASRDFRGGDLTAIMGGCDIDLREASIAGAEAVLEVFAMWGGITLRLPETWTVVNKVLPVLGGVDQKTRAASAAVPQTLVVRGIVLMGGVEIRN
jgi:hypothetical protein